MLLSEVEEEFQEYKEFIVQEIPSLVSNSYNIELERKLEEE